jgi:ferredoxin
MIREIIKIDEVMCDGCGVCVPACAEGALQIIDGKARLISDLFCDGLGACIAGCPQGAITIERREAEPYNESIVMETIVKGGQNVIKAHLKHLKDHGEFEYFTQAVDFLNHHNISIPVLEEELVVENACGCAGSAPKEIKREKSQQTNSSRIDSELRQWPIQLHLVSPQASYYKNSDLLLTADCVGFAYSNFHSDFLKDKSIAIACPKLDSNKQVYLDKLVTMINVANINSITVLIMEVPCCGGLYQLAQQAIEHSNRNVSLYVKIIGIEGEIIKQFSN